MSRMKNMRTSVYLGKMSKHVATILLLLFSKHAFEIMSCLLFYITLCLGREWTGDLKKLPNIKLRKMSSKGLDEKNEAEEKCEADEGEDGDEDDLDDEEVDEMVLMSDSN